MTGLVRKATLLIVLGIVAAASAMANVPTPANCDLPDPAYIRVVGMNGVTPDPSGTFTITVRNELNAPIPNCQVQLDFTGCTDLTLCNTGAAVNCPTKSVSVNTDINGVATFTVVGATNNVGASAGPGNDCVSVYAGGSYLLGTLTAVVYCQNDVAPVGADVGLTVADFVCLLQDWGAGNYRGRSDMDFDGALTPGDFVQIMIAWGDGNSASGCSTTYCP